MLLNVCVFAIYARCSNCSVVVGLYEGMIRLWASCMTCYNCMVNTRCIPVIGWPWLHIHT